ncbi:uncharacterized protein ATC70_010434 [Mucor velutinosus]|uniref:Uncharacterized protein n=1 Tax=Mucor velutinosus TaxID=708070 RepID=A0AAN7DER2_9FUNG|nr:hypothetical protein ATC70_010434 [Mucor velutinosus]
MFSGYQNKKKKKELANAVEKLSKPDWKSSEKFDSVAKSREIHQQPLPQPQESDVSNLMVHQRRKSLIINSAKPNPNAERIRKSTSVYDGLEGADMNKRPLNIDKALPANPDSKLQLDEFDTTQLEENIVRLAKEAGVEFDATQLSQENEIDHIRSILDQTSKDIAETYTQKINKESDTGALMTKGRKSLEENNAWIKDTCGQITEKLQQLKNEVQSKRMLETNRPQLRENLKMIIGDIAQSADEVWIPQFNELCQSIKSDSQQLHNDIHYLCKLFNDTSWEKELRKRTEKCFDIGDEAAFHRMKMDYTALFNQLFPTYSCSDEFIVACSHLAKSYVFPPPSPKHLITTANNSENSSVISVPEDISKRSSPSNATTANTIYTLKSKILPPLHFSNKKRADMFLSNLNQAKAYFQTDALHLYKSYDEHRLIKNNEACPCLLCEEAMRHQHGTTQCNFCSVHQNHNIKTEQDQENCNCGNCIHFSHYIQGLRFLTDEFADSTKYTASRSSSFQEKQHPTKEKKSLNKLIGGLLFDNNNKKK